MAKPSLTQQLLEQIMTTHKVGIAEAWKIYRQKYEDVELEPKIVV